MFKNLTKAQIEFTGTYAVLSELAKYGWTANLTPGTSKNTDIIAYKEIKGKTVYRRIEVKTTRSNFRLSNKTKDISGPHIFWSVGNIENRNLRDIIYIFVAIRPVQFSEAQELLKLKQTGTSLFIDIKNNIHEISFYIVQGRRVQKYLKEARIFRTRQNHKSYTDIRIGSGKSAPGSTIKPEESLSRWDLLESL